MTKLRSCYSKISTYYSLFELLCPHLYAYFEEIGLAQFSYVYENVISDYAKKTELVRKLSFLTLYLERVKIDYD